MAQLGTTLQAAVSDKGLGVEATQKVDKAMTGVNVGLSGGQLQVRCCGLTAAEADLKLSTPQLQGSCEWMHVCCLV